MNKPNDPQPTSRAEHLASIKKHLVKAGVLTEVKAAFEAERNDWHVELSRSYRDPIENKTREIDLLAGKTALMSFFRLAGKNARSYAGVDLVVEVKSGANPWVVVPTDFGRHRAHVMREYYGYLEHRSGPFERASAAATGIGQSILGSSDFIGAGIREAFRTEERASFAGLMGAVAAARACLTEKKAEDFGDNPDPALIPRFAAVHPVLLHGGELFRVGMSRRAMTLKSIPWAPVMCGRVDVSPGPCLIVDVVSAKAWPRYLRLMEERVVRLRSTASEYEADLGRRNDVEPWLEQA